MHLPTDIKGVDSLIDLAMNLHWSWNHATDEIWRRLDADLWELTHNPMVVLQAVGRDRLASVLADPDYLDQVARLVEMERGIESEPTWFQTAHSDASLTKVAYFSLEFMLSEALPVYSGGLGNVAGDQLKAASDLGVPVVGIGLLYQQGYFRQDIDKEGRQYELYPYNDPEQLPISPLRKADGEWLRLKVQFPGYLVWLRTWKVKVGRTMLYLLDTNDPANQAAHRGITSELYGGGLELRLKQELVLGIGGWCLLRALGIEPEVCHLNEGHAAFAVLERTRSFMEDTDQPFETALAATRVGNVFTTHTPVPAGFDRFPAALIKQYLSGYAQTALGISIDDLLALGQEFSGNKSDFNMAVLAINGSGTVNGVSALHGQVSRELFAPMFPRYPLPLVPVGHVTNGIHVPSWDSAASDELWTQHCGKCRWHGMDDSREERISKASDSQLWKMRTRKNRVLIDQTRQRLSFQLAARDMPQPMLDDAQNVLDPNVLTLTFARRFATYKRPNLLLSNPDRLIRLLNDPERPLQLIIAGKAHPADHAGKKMIQEWLHFVQRPEVRRRAVFLADYDMRMAESLVAGTDLWLNTPRRPWEASGTSGMKILANGGINISELDGWWAEAYTPEVGWALGDGKQHDDEAAWDSKEAEQLYHLIENEIAPEFYNRDENGIPKAWIQRIRSSMTQLTSQFSATRSVREYTEKYYLQAASKYRQRASNGGAEAQEIVAWKSNVTTHWPGVRFGAVTVETVGESHIFDAQVYLSELSPDSIRVEVFSEAEPSQRVAMARKQPLAGEVNGFHYHAEVPNERPASHYVPYIVPTHPGVAVPLEINLITWND